MKPELIINTNQYKNRSYDDIAKEIREMANEYKLTVLFEIPKHKKLDEAEIYDIPYSSKFGNYTDIVIVYTEKDDYSPREFKVLKNRNGL